MRLLLDPSLNGLSTKDPKNKEEIIEEYTPPYYWPHAVYIIIIVVSSLLTLLFGFLSYSTKIKRKRWAKKIIYGIVAVFFLSAVITSIIYWVDDMRKTKLHGFIPDNRDGKEKISDRDIYTTKINSNIDKVKVNLGGIPVLYINLDRSPKRRERMEAEGKKFDIDLIRVQGVEGSTLEWEHGEFETPYGAIKYINKFSPNTGTVLLGHSHLGELGCNLAHHKAIYTARFLNLSYAIIIEDDATLEHLALLKETIPSILERAPSEWEIINLFSPNCKSIDNPGEEFIPWQSSFSVNGIAGIGRKECYSAVAYIINIRGIEKLSSSNILILEPTILPKETIWPLNYVADNYIYGMTNSYICKTPTIMCKRSPSTLEHDSFLRDLFNFAPTSITLDDYRDSVIQEVLNQVDDRILPGIDVILYINLDKRKDRRSRIEREFRKIGISSENIRRISAVNTPENGAIGCLKSHIKACSIAINEYPGKNILICEDDIVFKKNGKETASILHSFISDPKFNNKVDVLMLAHNTQKSLPTHVSNTLKLIESQTTAAYVSNTKYLKKLLEVYEEALETFNKNGIWKQIYCSDQCWKILQQRDNWYGFSHPLVIQGESYSDIENMVVKY